MPSTKVPHGADPVIVALDVESAEQARRVVDALGADCHFYKVGLQLLTAAGPVVVRDLVASGKRVFLDLKLHEIPHSAAGAVHAAGKLGVSFVTVHASAGASVLRAAARAAQDHPGLQVLALTVITSLSDDDLPEIGLPPSVDQQVARLGLLAMNNGCDGVVASPREVALLRRHLPAGALVVCPGVQLDGTANGDQARAGTVQEAARDGASHVVIGRGVTGAADPSLNYRGAVAAFESARR